MATVVRLPAFRSRILIGVSLFAWCSNPKWLTSLRCFANINGTSNNRSSRASSFAAGRLHGERPAAHRAGVNRVQTPARPFLGLQVQVCEIGNPAGAFRMTGEDSNGQGYVQGLVQGDFAWGCNYRRYRYLEIVAVTLPT